MTSETRPPIRNVNAGGVAIPWTLTDLRDCPAALGTPGQALIVNAAGDGLEFGSGGGGGGFATIPEIDRPNYSLTNDFTYYTFTEPELVAASATAALILITFVIDFNAGGTVGDLAQAYSNGRATGSGDDDNELYVGLYTITQARITVANYSGMAFTSRQIVQCGTGGDAGLFDVAFGGSPPAACTITGQMSVVGYWY